MPEPDNQPEDDIDRSPPFGVLSFGEAFLQSAKHLDLALEEKELCLKFDPRAAVNYPRIKNLDPRENERLAPQRPCPLHAPEV